MPVRQPHDAPPPSHWPASITYLTKPRLSPTFPASLIPLLSSTSTLICKFNPRTIRHPNTVTIKLITQIDHPAKGQYGLFAKMKIKENELIIPYLGIIHVTFTPETEGDEKDTQEDDEHTESDYDLSLLRLSASDSRNPFQGKHISIGVDAASAGNAARFVNDYRGIGISPNAEFKIGSGENGELRMEIWSLKGKTEIIGKGEEILVSYGKGWWGARS